MRHRAAVATQTPLLRYDAAPVAFVGSRAGGAGRGAGGAAVLTQRLADRHISPGGVSRMEAQTIRAWQRSGWLAEAHWFSLQPQGPPHVHLADVGIHAHHLHLPPEGLAAYARTKERLWADLHGLQAPRFDRDDFRFYARYNWLASDAIFEHLPNLDLVYVHDFQLLQVGAILGLSTPCFLRWHVPFDPQRIPRYTRDFILRSMEAYDGVVVSTRRDVEGLANVGFRGRVRQVYPHSDPADWPAPGRAAADAFAARTALPADAPVVLYVARMDPMKRQDLPIEALARLRHRHPDAHLVLVGNGSFSGSRLHGLGLGKADHWRAHLEALALRLGVADRVVFTGWLPDDLVAAAYARADVLVLASDAEGFGLTPFEAWGHGKPCVISTGCGAAEVVQDTVTGRLFPAGDAEALAAALDDVLRHREAATRMGEAGRQALAAFSPDAAAEKLAAFLDEGMRRFGRTG